MIRVEILTADDSTPTPVCAWCPGFDRTAHVPNSTHTICPTCLARVMAELDAVEEAAEEVDDDDDDREELAGSECGRGCGYCGRCS